LDNISLSENKFLGFLGSICNPHLSKNNTAIIYANDVELDVCPEAAFVIDYIESILKILAIPSNCSK